MLPYQATVALAYALPDAFGLAVAGPSSAQLLLDARVDIGGWETEPMRHSGGQVYRAVIPLITSGFVDYTVRVRDLAGNVAFGPAQGFHAGAIQLPIDGFESGNTSRWSSTAPLAAPGERS